MKHPKPRRGTTLVEVMAAMMILALTVSAAGAMFPLGAFLRNRSGGNSRAAAIVQRKLEQVRKIPANSLTYAALETADIIDNDDTTPAPFTTTDSLASELTSGTGTISLSGVGTDVVEVTVTVSWVNTRNGAHSLSATTRVVNKEVWVRP